MKRLALFALLCGCGSSSGESVAPPRVLVVGWDGASFEQPLREDDTPHKLAIVDGSWIMWDFTEEEKKKRAILAEAEQQYDDYVQGRVKELPRFREVKAMLEKVEQSQGAHARTMIQVKQLGIGAKRPVSPRPDRR